MTTATAPDPTAVNRAEVVYESPTLVEIGSVHDLTLVTCILDKKWGGSDGVQFLGINIPISSC